MTGAEMVSQLGLRVGDPAGTSFPVAVKLDALNLAQHEVVNMVDNAYLRELETIEAATATNAHPNDTAFFRYASLPASLVRNGLILVKDAVGGNFSVEVSVRDAKRTENTYMAGSVATPVHYIWGGNLYIKPVAVTSVDYWYLLQATDLENGSTACVLNVALQGILMDFAEAMLWRMNGRPDLAENAKQSGIQVIEILNARYDAWEKAAGIGTRGENDGE